MKITVKTTVLAKMVATAAKAVRTNNIAPAFDSLKIDADDKLTITGSSADVTIVVTHPADEDVKIDETGAVLINSRFMSDVVRKLASENSSVVIQTVDNNIKITAGGAKYTVRSLDVKAYPTLDLKKPAKGLRMKRDMLKSFVNEVHVCAAHGKLETPVLNGLHFVTRTPNEMIIEGTDAHRYAAKTITYSGNEMDYVIPGEVLQLAVTHMEGDDLQIGFDDRKIQIFDSNMLIQGSIYEGAYPETSRLIENEALATREMVIDRKALLTAIDRCSLMKDQGSIIVRLTMTKDGVNLKASSPDFGDYTDHLDVKSWKGDDLALSMDGSYLADTLKAVGGDEVTLKFVGELRPVIIRGEAKNLVHILVPIRTYED